MIFNHIILKNSSFKGLGVAVCAIIASQAVASGTNVYQYTDQNGRMYLTNIQKNTGGAEKFTQVSVTHYADTKLHSNPAQIPVTYNPTTASTPSRSANRNAYDHLIRSAAARHGVDPALVKAVVHTESAFNPSARSPVGAMGLMQLMPGTARDMGVSNAWDPAQNIEGGVKYLAWLKRQFSNLDYVIAAYNAGHGNVKKYGGIPPFRETQNYVKSVKNRYQTLYRHDASLMAGYPTQQALPQLANAAPVATPVAGGQFAAPQNGYRPVSYNPQVAPAAQRASMPVAQPAAQRVVATAPTYQVVQGKIVAQPAAQPAQYHPTQASYQQVSQPATTQQISYATTQNPSLSNNAGKIFITNGKETFQR